jgi:hypothetical protein
MKKKKTPRSVRKARNKLSNGLATLYACSSFIKEEHAIRVIDDAKEVFDVSVESKGGDNA